MLSIVASTYYSVLSYSVNLTGWMDSWRDGLMNGWWMDEWTDEWMSEGMRGT